MVSRLHVEHHSSPNVNKEMIFAIRGIARKPIYATKLSVCRGHFLRLRSLGNVLLYFVNCITRSLMSKLVYTLSVKVIASECLNNYSQLNCLHTLPCRTVILLSAIGTFRIAFTVLLSITSKYCQLDGYFISLGLKILRYVSHYKEVSGLSDNTYHPPYPNETYYKL